MTRTLRAYLKLILYIVLFPLFFWLAVIKYILKAIFQEQETVIIFSRYPEPGKCKKRLIPGIGAENAALIQKEMTEHVVRTALTWSQQKPSFFLERVRKIEVYYSFDSDTERTELLTLHEKQKMMEDWLGSGTIIYNEQVPGDLTLKLLAALRDRQSREHFAFIASDTPGITVDILNRSFKALAGDNASDVVIGPAKDGGYYLLGMARPIEELIVGYGSLTIPWSTERVFSTTMEICHKLKLQVANKNLIPILADIDHPSELSIWRDEQNRSIEEGFPLISVIVPVLNESSMIEQTLKRLSTGYHVEIIVVDGGSTDGTLRIANEFKHKLESDHLELEAKMLNVGAQYKAGKKRIKKVDMQVVLSGKGRAKQQNYGASLAQGEILLFVHGDSLVPVGYDSLIRSSLGFDPVSKSQKKKNPMPVAGAFRFHMENDDGSISMIGRFFVHIITNLRAKYLSLPYGDQSLYMTKKTFVAAKGFPSFELMEDFELVRRLKKLGSIEILDVPNVTAGRRWRKLGIVKNTAFNQFIILGYLCGISPSKLAAWYYGAYSPFPAAVPSTETRSTKKKKMNGHNTKS